MTDLIKLATPKKRNAKRVNRPMIIRRRNGEETILKHDTRQLKSVKRPKRVEFQSYASIQWGILERRRFGKKATFARID